MRTSKHMVRNLLIWLDIQALSNRRRILVVAQKYGLSHERTLRIYKQQETLVNEGYVLSARGRMKPDGTFAPRGRSI